MNPSPSHQTPCDHCGRYDNRSVTVDAIVTNEKKEILLIRRGHDPFQGSWALPGGFLDKNERVEEGVVREAAEETGVTMKNLQFVGAYGDPARDPRQTVAITYWGTTTDTPHPGDDAVEAKFFSAKDLPDNIAFDHRKMIDDFLSVR